MAESYRAKMPASHRAKQFAPFQSLKGFEEAIQNKTVIFNKAEEHTVQKNPFPFADISLNSTISVIYLSNDTPTVISGTVTDINKKSGLISIDSRQFKCDELQAIIF